jgi:NAD(P)H-hydrate epimerase
LKVEGGLTYLTAEEMKEVDRTAIEDFGIDVLSLMENAGIGVAGLGRRMLGEEVAGKKIVCLVGKGNNGGDGLVAARHLHNWGASVSVVLVCEKGEMRDVPASQLGVVEKMSIPISRSTEGLGEAELLVDALLGYGSRGSPMGPVANLIRTSNEVGVRILAVDIPSGLDATTGEPGDPCIVASATVTLGLPKTGFLNPRSRRFVGELYLADISLPREVYARYPAGPAGFGRDTLRRIL